MNKFYQKKSITKKVVLGDEEVDVKFYSIPVGTILKMKTAGKQLSKFIAVLLSDKSNDISTETSSVPSDIKDEGGTPYINSHVQKKEISPTLASFRHKQLTESIDGLFDELTAPDTLDLVAEIIIKSASDHFSPEEQKDLLDNLPMDVTIALLTGAFEASAGGIKGLGKSLSPQIQAALGEAKAKVGDLSLMK